MFKPTRRLSVTIALLTLLTIWMPPVHAQDAAPQATPESTPDIPQSFARVRVGMYAADGPHVDLFVGDALTLHDIPYPATTNYLTLPAQTAAVITVTTSDGSRTNPILPPLTVDLAANHTYTLAVLVDDPNATPDPSEYRYQARWIDETALIAEGAPGTARVITLNAIPGQTLTALYADQIENDIAYGDSPAIALTPQDVLLIGRLSNGAQFANTLSLRADLLYFVVVYGSVTAPQPTLEVSGTKSLAQLLRDSADFSLFYALIEQAGLVDALTLDAPFTVFAPSNEAFIRYMAENNLQSDTLLSNPDLINEIVRYHVARGLMFSDTVASMALVPMLDGHDIGVAQDANGIILNQTARILIADVLATNGVIHAVDTVMATPKNAE